MKIFRVNTSHEPPTIDPRKTSDNISAYVIKMCFEGLTRLKNDKPVLSLAKSYTVSEDQREYTFKLKEAYWSDGTRITAHDFEESWKTVVRPDFPAMTANALYYVKNGKKAKEGKVPLDEFGVKAIDDETLHVVLEFPNPIFLSLIAHCAYFPYPERIAKINLKYLEDHSRPFISSGPFHPRKWHTQDRILFEKSKTYWDKDVVKLDEVHLSFVPDQNTELSMYEQGDLDWAGQPFSNLPSDSMASVKKREDFHSYKISGTYYYVFNTKKFPFTNKNIRKALALAVNRKDLIEHVFQVDHEPATSLIPNIVESLKKGLFNDADIVKAREYFRQGLEELELTPETFPKITLSHNTEPNIHFKVAQAIQQQWKKVLGISTGLQNQEWKVYMDSLAKEKFEVARMGISSLASDPAFFIEMFAYEIGGFDFSKWYNPKYESLYLQAMNTTNNKKRLEILYEAEEILMDEMPIAPLFFYSNNYLKRDYVKNVIVDAANNFELKWADMDN